MISDRACKQDAQLKTIKQNAIALRHSALAIAIVSALSAIPSVTLALNLDNAKSDAYAGSEGARAAASVGDSNVGASANGSATAVNEEGSLSATNAAAAAAVLTESNGVRQSSSVYTPITSSNDVADGPALSDSSQSSVTATAANANTAATAAAGVADSRSTLSNTTTTYSGAAAVTLTSTSEATATATATSNDVENNAITRAASSAAAAAYSSASITKNNVTITGVSTGIALSANASATATANATSAADSFTSSTSAAPTNETSDAVSSAESAAYSRAVIGGSLADQNVIRNTGSITAASAGISLRTEASATVSANATATAEVEGSPNSSVAANYTAATTRDEAVAITSYNDIGNSGTIRVTGGNGIQFIADADRATGDHFQATASVLNNTISNTGTLITSGDGIRLFAEALDSNVTNASSTARVANNQITNTGTIYSLIDGVHLNSSLADTTAVESNTITNNYSGRIVAKENAIEIISANVSGNTISSSGLLVSDTNMSLNGSTLVKGAAFAFNSGTATTNAGTAIKITGNAAGTNNVVNLMAPAYVAGKFEFNRTAEVNVNLASGISHSVRWVFQDDTTASTGAEKFSSSGLVPWFSRPTESTVQNGTPDEFATIDPSAFAAAPNQLADLSGLVSGIAAEGLNRSGTERNGLWLSVRASKMDYDSDGLATMKQNTRIDSAAIGYARDFDNLRLGVFAGYSDSRLKVGSLYPDIYLNSYDNQAEGGFIGLHSLATMGPINLQFGLSAGVLDHDDKRFVNDNLQWWGESYARSKYDSFWYSPELTLSAPIALTKTVSLTPTIHGRYAAQKIDQYTETGSNANATVYEHTVKIAELRAGLELKKTYSGGSTTALTLGYLQRDLHGNESVRVTMIGDTKQVPYFTQELQAGFAGLALNLALSKSVTFKLDANYVNGSEGEGGQAGVAVRVVY